MKTKFISIFTVVLLLTLILFSRTSSSSSSLTFSSSDWRSQVMQGRYILPNAPANYVDFGPRNRDLYVQLSDDQELYEFMRYTENTTGDMRIASSNLIVHRKLKPLVLGKPVIGRAVNYRLTKCIYKKTF
jgi:hypothetical protein